MPKGQTSPYLRLYGSNICDLAKEFNVSVRAISNYHHNGKLKSRQITIDTNVFKKRDDRIRHLFQNIKNRCTNPNHNRYEYYGGKGIKTFLTYEDLVYLWKRDNADSLLRPSIDRIDSNGHYTLANCRMIELVENIFMTSIKPRRSSKKFNLLNNDIRAN